MRNRFGHWIVLFCLAIGVSTPSAAEEIAPEALEFFERQIRPVLVERCYGCHSAEAEKLKGELYLDSRDGMQKGGVSGVPVIIPNSPEGSLLIRAVRYHDHELQMPPESAGGKLSDAQIADLVSWVQTGAPDPRTNETRGAKSPADASQHWAFQPVKLPAVPNVRKERWVCTPIDSFILARLEEEGLQPSPRADKRTLIRRVSFDLTGLPPTHEETEAFVNDRSPDAFEKVVDRLLDSPRYGERWGRHWLDVARFADTKGYVYGREESRFVHSYAYRDWVIRALNDDMPYDQFLKLQIAADQMDGATVDSLAAMGFLTLGRRFLGVVHDIIDDRIDVVTRGTLGLTVSCARCHDHKYDPVPTADYYSLYGVFAGSTERPVPLRGAAQSAKAYLEFETELRKREEAFQSALNAKREQQNKRLRAKVAEYLVAVLDVQKYPSEEFYSFVQADELNPVIVRKWHSYLIGSPTNHPVWGLWRTLQNIPELQFADRAKGILSSTNSVQANGLVQKAFQDEPPKSMRDVAAVYGKLLSSIEEKWENGKDKNLTKEEEELRQVLYAADSPAAVPSGALVDLEWFFDEPTRVELGNLFVKLEQWIVQSPGAPPYAVIMEDRPVQKNPHIFRRGNPATKGDEVPRQFLKILSPEQTPFKNGSGRRELAEAIASKDNPLTARVMVNRVWAHHFGKGIVRTPSDFGVRAEAPSHPELLDWLAHHFVENGWSLKKLHRVIVLSSTYQQSSQLHRDTKAALVDPENKLLSRMNRERLDFESLRDALLAVSGELDLTAGGRADEMFTAPFSKRRSIYGFIDRKFLPGALRMFDFANPDMHTPERAETTVPQQALFLMNGDFAIEQARALANRSEWKELSPERRLKEFYKRVYQREPTSRQLRAGLEFVRNTESNFHESPSTSQKPSDWRYGYGEFDATIHALKMFHELPHFTGEAWQGGRSWPDSKLGWVQLTATGGHAGNDHKHAVVRRWVSPVKGTISISGELKHERPAGNGIRGYIVSNRHRLLGQWTLHNKAEATNVKDLAVEQGDTIDFIVSINTDLNSNDFHWAPILEMTGPDAPRDANGYARKWDAKKDFDGPPATIEKPLDPWEQYAQVLLLSNEFLFVD